MSGEQFAMLCGKTFSSLIMSNDQMTSPSVLSWYFSPWNPVVPVGEPVRGPGRRPRHRLDT